MHGDFRCQCKGSFLVRNRDPARTGPPRRHHKAFAVGGRRRAPDLPIGRNVAGHQAARRLDCRSYRLGGCLALSRPRRYRFASSSADGYDESIEHHVSRKMEASAGFMLGQIAGRHPVRPGSSLTGIHGSPAVWDLSGAIHPTQRRGLRRVSDAPDHDHGIAKWSSRCCWVQCGRPYV